MTIRPNLPNIRHHPANSIITVLSCILFFGHIQGVVNLSKISMLGFVVVKFATSLLALLAGDNFHFIFLENLQFIFGRFSLLVIFDLTVQP